jgi:D-alanyl-lipoteichoic acid acyltransferase DltB (MBOAT superfamily)
VVFYAIAGLKYLPFIFVTSFTVWLAGRRMGRIYEVQEEASKELSRKEKKALKEEAKAKCRGTMLWTLVLNLGILAACKYLKFFIGPVNALLGAAGSGRTLSAESIIVPLGISYYTFSALSYLLDVYWRRVEREKSYPRFLLYLIYFPHILQGPIERYGRLGERLKQELRFDYQRVTFGVQLIVWGFMKKLIIADRLDIFITKVYKGYEQAGGVLFLVAAFFDVVYIYADFSGCMDMARGISQIFGVELDLNFDHPFASLSIAEFWRRWHITLGEWFRDYVYYPVSTSKLVKNIGRKTRNRWPQRLSRLAVNTLPVAATWIMTGLWHGTGKTYLAWGIYYTFWLLLSTTFGDDLHQLALRLHFNTENASWRLFQMVRTTLIFAGGRLLTRPGSLRRTLYIVRGIVTNLSPWQLTDGSLFNFGLDAPALLVSVVFIALLGVVDWWQQKTSVRVWIAQQGIVFRWLVYLGAVLAILVFGIYGPGYSASSFVYMAY